MLPRHLIGQQNCICLSFIPIISVMKRSLSTFSCRLTLCELKHLSAYNHILSNQFNVHQIQLAPRRSWVVFFIATPQLELWCYAARQPEQFSSSVHSVHSPELHQGLHLKLSNKIHTLIIDMTDHLSLRGSQE